jgi:116 kDa U5 small nuclear ribonucleoprotein component
MASLEDYDEFGNYIGGDLESDEEDGSPHLGPGGEAPTIVPSAAPLEGFDKEAEPEESALMEVDGMLQ